MPPDPQSRSSTRVQPAVSSRRSESRRRDARRQRSEHRGTLWQRLTRSFNPVVLLIWTGFFLCTLLVLLAAEDVMPYRLGQRIDSDIVARVRFTMEDPSRTKNERELARALAPNVFTANDAPLEAIRGRMTELLALAKSTDDPAKFAEAAAASGWQLGQPAFDALRAFTGDDKIRDYDALVARLVNQLRDEYLVEAHPDANRKKMPRTSKLRRGDQISELLTNRLQYASNREEVEKAARRAVTSANVPPPLRDVVTGLIVLTIAGPDPAKPSARPLWLYDVAATAEEVRQAEEAVVPITDTWEPGARLVSSGSLLTLDNLSLLKREHEQYLKAQDVGGEIRTRKLLYGIGLAVILLLATGGLMAYTASYQGRVFQNPTRALALAGLLLLMVALSRLSQWPRLPPEEFCVSLVVIAAALLTIAYDQRFSLGVSAVLAVLLILSVRGDFGLFLTLQAASAMTVLSLADVRTRSRIIAAGGLAALAAFVASLAAGMIAGQDYRYALYYAGLASIAAVAAGFIVQGILPGFERIFGVATSMTLLEWADAGRPLLRRLSQEAPGTFSHSQTISQLAEEACEVVGARGLLARVGALYHDIGKMQKSEYFVENQEARINRHDRLSPTMSLLIIVGHVKDGVELAKAYGVPRILHQFIAEHHGTTVVKYFHHAATEAAAKNKGRHDREVSESEFRYPGPKPRTKESAILMICDGCESAVRSLSEPTPGRIESMVHHVVMDRLNDGQFDECPITMREIKLVEQALVKSLCAIHHGRIKYPKDPGRQPQPAPSGDGRDDQDAKRPAEQPPRTPEVVQQA